MVISSTAEPMSKINCKSISTGALGILLFINYNSQGFSGPYGVFSIHLHDKKSEMTLKLSSQRCSFGCIVSNIKTGKRKSWGHRIR